MTETAKSIGSDEKSTSSNFLKKSALSQAAAKEWSAATSGFAGRLSKPPASLISFGMTTGKKDGDSNAPKVDAPSGFVFGSRLAERVSNATTTESDEKPTDVSSIFKKVANTAPTNLFLTPNKTDDGTIKSFTESAKGDGANKSDAELSAKSVVEAEPVETITGEEGEKNLLHTACKFFVFDREQKTWQERGLGTLRINENMENPQTYRIIGRATGNQRVCLNSKIFPEMLLEKISDKRIKISAVDPDSELPQLFVIHASQSSIQNVHRMLESLLPKVKSAARRKRRLDSAHDSEVPTKNTPTEQTSD